SEAGCSAAGVAAVPGADVPAAAAGPASPGGGVAAACNDADNFSPIDCNPANPSQAAMPVTRTTRGTNQLQPILGTGLLSPKIATAIPMAIASHENRRAAQPG